MSRAGHLAALAGALLLWSGITAAGWIAVLAAACLWVASYRRGGSGAFERPSPGLSGTIRPRTELAVLALIIVAGASLRLYHLNQTPPGCWFDEAENGLETNRILGGDLFFFTPRNNGRGALQFFWTAPFFLALGA
ncbi:MAG: hypothetical protein ACREDF_10450, partial [Thermoplasmata archaeon]